MGYNFFGAIVGYGIGYLVDTILASTSNQSSNQQRFQNGSQNYRDPFQQMPRGYGQGEQHDFISILLMLSAAVMKADGKVLKSELDYLKTFFQGQFGHQFTRQHLAFLKETLDQDHININETCSFLRYRTTEEVRIQLIHYLFGIAKADNHVSENEINIIYRIARQLHVSDADFQSIKNMFYRNPQSDYVILGITESATDSEIKSAYRKMAIKYHPDKVQDMGQEHQKAAKEKFQQIQSAYENIKKTRGLK
jgi:DnaJ like chaperone protein